MLDRMFDGMRKRYDRMRGDEQWLREGGIAGTAEILSITETGKWIGVESHGQDQIFRVDVRVTIPGQEPYDVQHETVDPPYNAKTVPCYVDPNDRTRIYLDRDAAAAGQVAEQLSAATGQPVAGDWESIQAATQAMAASAQQQMAAFQRQFASAPAAAPVPAQDEPCTDGRATVVGATERQMTLPTGSKLFELELEVRLPGEEPYRVAVLSEVPGALAQYVQVGLEVAVTVADARRTAVIVNWDS